MVPIGTACSIFPDSQRSGNCGTAAPAVVTQTTRVLEGETGARWEGVTHGAAGGGSRFMTGRVTPVTPFHGPGGQSTSAALDGHGHSADNMRSASATETPIVEAGSEGSDARFDLMQPTHVSRMTRARSALLGKVHKVLHERPVVENG